MKRLRDQDVTPRAPRTAVPVTAAEAPSARGSHGVARGLGRVAVVLSPVLLLWGAWGWTCRTPGFAVRRVVVTGTGNARAEAVAERSGALGANAFALDLEDVRARVLAEPWLTDAVVRRALPHELRIAVTEAEPVAVEVVEGRRMALDASGRTLGDAAALALPEIRGLAAVASRDRAARRRLAAATLSALKERAPRLFARAEALDAAEDGKLVLVSAGRPPLWLAGPGSADEAAAWDRREQGIERAIDRAAWVDARWRDRLFVVPATPGRGAP